jgi:small subunit ribosomal protein S9
MADFQMNTGEMGETLGSTAAAAALAAAGVGSGASGGAMVEARPVRQAKEADAQGWWHGTGRRKTAVARVRIKPGKGDIEIVISRKKTRTVEDSFSEERDRNDVVAPLKATGAMGKIDVKFRLSGGGYMGQAQAARLALARALINYDPSFFEVLRDEGYLTRDARKVERKKYGQAGARRRFQFSKR